MGGGILSLSPSSLHLCLLSPRGSRREGAGMALEPGCPGSNPASDGHALAVTLGVSHLTELQFPSCAVRVMMTLTLPQGAVGGIH